MQLFLAVCLGWLGSFSVSLPIRRHKHDRSYQSSTDKLGELYISVAYPLSWGFVMSPPPSEFAATARSKQFHQLSLGYSLTPPPPFVCSSLIRNAHCQSVTGGFK